MIAIPTRAFHNQKALAHGTRLGGLGHCDAVTCPYRRLRFPSLFVTHYLVKVIVWALHVPFDRATVRRYNCPI